MVAALFGAGYGLIAVVIFGLWYVFAYIIRKLADIDILVTYPVETTAKAIMRNGRVHRLVMAYKGRCFAGDLDPTLEEPVKWQVVKGNVRVGSRLPFIRGIRWLGIPPFSEIYKYRFSWASLEEKSVNEDIGKNAKWEEKIIDYIFLRSDVYVTKLELAECSDNIPLNIMILVGGEIVNPYKALFTVERWLEASLNVIDSRMRSFIGGKSYVELRAIAEAMRAGTPGADHALSLYFHEALGEIEDKWGFKTDFVQIYSIDPGSKLAEEFIRATTLVYVAQQQRDANIATGEGLAARDKKHFEAFAGIANGAELFKWDSIRQSNLTTYVEGGNITTSIPVGGQAAPRRQTPSEPATPDAPTPA